MIISKKTFKISTALALVPFCLNVFAAEEQFSGAFRTIKNVDIIEVTPLVINGLFPAANSSCTVATPDGATAFPGETVMKMANVSAAYTLGPGADAGTMTSSTTPDTCSSTAISVPGIYEIEGAAGADVDITLSSATASGITFVPVGCAVDFDTNISDGDVCLNIPNGTPTEITLADTGDLVNSAGQGTPELGVSRLAVGGTVTNAIGLAAAAPYTVPFEIVVSY